MRLTVGKVLTIAAVALIASSILGGGLLGRGAALLSCRPTYSPRAAQLNSVLSQFGVEILSSAGTPGGVQLTLRWPDPGTNQGADALERARRQRLIRAWSPAGSNNIDIRYHHDRKYFVGKFNVTY